MNFMSEAFRGPIERAPIAHTDLALRMATNGNKVAQAEGLMASRLSRIRAANTKIAGFETLTGRHLAIQRPDRSINIWTEDLSGPEVFRNFERYPAARSRHSNLAAQAPRVAAGRPARLWHLESIADVAALLDWYECT